MSSTSLQRPLISIIVPVYNTSRWLRKCMDSLCHQTYQKLQIIAVDDGSKDDSLAILQEYKEKDSRVEIIHQENAGLSAARNAGLSLVKGEWITGVDSDDFLDLHTYETLIAKLNQSADIVCYGTQPIDEKDKKVSLHIMDILFDGTIQASPELAQLAPPTFPTKLWKREFFEKWELQFAHGLLHEDEILWRQACAVAKNIQFVPDKLYCYLQRSGSIMHNRQSALKKTDDYCKLIEEIARFYEKYQCMATWGASLAHLMGGLYQAGCKLAQNRTEKNYVTERFATLAKQINFGAAAQNVYPIRELQHPNKLLGLFYKREFNKISYCIFGLPLWAVRIRKNTITHRLLGVPMFKQKIKSIDII